MCSDESSKTEELKRVLQDPLNKRYLGGFIDKCYEKFTKPCNQQEDAE